MRRRIRAIGERGKVVVIDPRRTETAKVASEHVFLRPGTDAWLLLAMLHVVFDEGLDALGRLEPFVDGVDAIAHLVRDFPPERVAPITGVDPATIQRLARELAGAERGVLYGRIGTCVQEFGGLAAWLVNVVNVVTGHFDRPGGAMFPHAGHRRDPGRRRGGHRSRQLRSLEEPGPRSARVRG